MLRIRGGKSLTAAAATEMLLTFHSLHCQRTNGGILDLLLSSLDTSYCVHVGNMLHMAVDGHELQFI